MIIRNPKRTERIRAVVFFFSVFVALMLFQTSYMRLGTITAAAAILLTIAAYFFQGGFFNARLKIFPPTVTLVLFLAYNIIRVMSSSQTPSYFVPYMAQMLLCLIAFSVSLTDRENEYLKNIFTISATVYAVLIIKSIYENRIDDAYHTDVLIFNTSFDPNYIGIPLSAATALLLNNVLRNKRKVISMVMYAIIVFAVILTASRGCFLAALVSNVLVLISFVLQKQASLLKKLAMSIIPVLAVVLLILIFREVLPREWARMSRISSETDSGRLVLWEYAIENWKKAPFFGMGFNNAVLAHGKVTHNTYLQVLSETGIVGLLLMLAFILPMLIKGWTVDGPLACAFVGVLVQIAFLDAAHNRCLWILLCWIAMSFGRKDKWKNEGIISKNTTSC